MPWALPPPRPSPPLQAHPCQQQTKKLANHTNVTNAEVCTSSPPTIRHKHSPWLKQRHARSLTLFEYVLFVNVQLIPILLYRLMAHPLSLGEVGGHQTMIWQNIAHHSSPEKANRICRLVSRKARYIPRHQGGCNSAIGVFLYASPQWSPRSDTSTDAAVPQQTRYLPRQCSPAHKIPFRTR